MTDVTEMKWEIQSTNTKCMLSGTLLSFRVMVDSKQDGVQNSDLQEVGKGGYGQNKDTW